MKKEELKKLVELSDGTLTATEIGEILGYSKENILYHIRKHKLPKYTGKGGVKSNDIDYYKNKNENLIALNIINNKIQYKCKKCDMVFLTNKQTFIKNTNICKCSRHKNKKLSNQQNSGNFISQTLYGSIKSNAKRRKIEFNISKEYINNLYIKQNKLCALSNYPIGFAKTDDNNSNKTASLDRINSNIGYIEGNVQWLHKDINFMKQSFPEGELMKHCKSVITHNKKPNKNIVVWGGAGFIGCQLIQDLLVGGYVVSVYDNLTKGPEGLFSYINNPNFKFYEKDIRDENDIIESLSGKVDGIILLAGLVGLDICNEKPIEAEAVNNLGWGYLCKHKPKNIPLVAASTGSVYGKLESQCTEDSPTNPLSIYGQTKLAGEKHVVDCGGVALRFATAGGISPQMRLNLLPNQLTYEAIKIGYLNIYEHHAMRTFIDIRDFSAALIHFLEVYPSLKHQIYNVGSQNNNISKGELAKLIKDKTGCLLTYAETHKDPDARDYFCDYTRLSETGFKCKYSIDEMIDTILKMVPLLQREHKYL